MNASSPTPPRDLVLFCKKQHPYLVGALAFYCGDADVAQELAQETLARVCRDWKKVSKLAAPEAWAHRVAINLARSYFRRRGAERRARLRLESETHAPSPSWPSGERLDLLNAISRLPERQRAAVVLRYYADLPISDIAETLRCPEGTVKTLIHRGLRNLSQTFELKETEAADAI